jgi:dGTPase
MTHTMEVSCIARTLARALGLNEDLAEAIALAHDLGHPPFGHAGERALDACLADLGGFDHNAQTLRVVTSIERRYAAFDGLNLCWETLEGIVKHNGPLTDRAGNALERYAERGVPAAIRLYGACQDLQLWSYPSAEAQVAGIADDIAYDAHDMDDGLRADLFGLDDLADIAIVRDIRTTVTAQYPGLETPRLVHEVIRRTITRMIEGVIAESQRRLAALAPRSVDDVRNAGSMAIGFSPEITQVDAAIKAFLYPRMYRHPRIASIMTDAEGVVRDLFHHFMRAPASMPPEWLQDLDAGDEAGKARRVADFIAGMTDGYALKEHARFFDSTPELS